MRRTMWLDEFNRYYARVYENDELICYTDTDERRQGNIVIQTPTRYIGGSAIDLLAEYEDTGLTPEEINQLKYVDIKNLKAANDRLLENNNEYFREYQKLLDENDHLKALLRRYLDEDA